MSSHHEPSVHNHKHERFPLSAGRLLTVMGHWLGSTLPVWVVVTCGLLVFRQAVVSSVASTPHPELVYAIGGTFFLGVLLTCITLYRFTIEGNLVYRWTHAYPKQRQRLLSSLRWQTYLLPLFEIMLGQRRLSNVSMQAVIEQEIAAVSARFNDRLALPHYLAGALVGLGLVGTFVGLLGTLEDLGKLFGALVETGSATTNPAEIFSDMVRRLQDPMRGMGTAFVASLYGLLGSLVLGLQILAVGKISHGLINQLHVTVRRAEMVAIDAEQSHISRSAAHVSHHNTWTDLHALTEKILAQVQAVNETKDTPSEKNKNWEELDSLLLAHLKQNHHETHILRREIFNLTQTTQSLAMAVRESIQADDHYRKSVPRTTYWQEAWVKVQAYLQRSNTDQTLSELSRISRQQSHLLTDISSSLQNIEQRMRTPFDTSIH